MTIRDQIRRWLGLDQIESELKSIATELHNLETRLQDNLTKLESDLHYLRARTAPETLSEFDPARIAESSRIGKEVMQRLHAEAAARAPYNKA